MSAEYVSRLEAELVTLKTSIAELGDPLAAATTSDVAARARSERRAFRRLPQPGRRAFRRLPREARSRDRARRPRVDGAASRPRGRGEQDDARG